LDTSNTLFSAVRELRDPDFVRDVIDYAFYGSADTAKSIGETVRRLHYDGPLAGEFEQGDRDRLFETLDALKPENFERDPEGHFEAWLGFIEAVASYDRHTTDELAVLTHRSVDDVHRALAERLNVATV
jgi:hypothetical protein